MSDSDDGRRTFDLARRTPEARGGRVRLPQIGPRAYEHPADAATLDALRRLKGLDAAVRWMMGALSERRLRYWFLAGAVRVNERQLPELHAALLECCAVLDLPEVPEMYLMQQPIVNAGAIGADRPFIVLSSALVELLSPDELRYVIGHEVGHILSNHVLYKNLLAIVLQISNAKLAPMSGIALWAVITALREWDRKSELSADRAGLLCMQDPQGAMQVLMKTAGGYNSPGLNLDELLAQAAEYESGGDLRDGAVKLLNLLGSTHPFPVVRLAELKRWVDGGDYERILVGDYARRGTTSDTYDDWTAAIRSYRATVQDSKDPLFRTLNEIGESLNQAGQAVRDQLKEIFGGGRKPD